MTTTNSFPKLSKELKVMDIGIIHRARYFTYCSDFAEKVTDTQKG